MLANNMVIQLLLILSLSLIFLYFWIKLRNASSILTNWPILGMIPCLLMNCHRVHDLATEVLKERHRTFEFKGPVLANLDLLVTCDLANINYILSKNFSNYPKGPEFHKIFEIIGDGMLNVDGHLWEFQRKTNISLFSRPDFSKMVLDIMRNKVKKGLIPVLDDVLTQGMEVDLQEIFQRLNFDTICSLLLDHDPESLSLGLPSIPCEKAFAATEEALFYRHIFPECTWKLQRWIGLGKERSLNNAWKAFDEFIYGCISMKRKKLLSKNTAAREDKLDLLTTYMETYKGLTANSEKFLRDSLLALLIAGRDSTSTTLTWFFWLLSKNPSVESKIHEEIERKLIPGELESWTSFNKTGELRKLVYLHAALSETLRLFPPIAFLHMAPVHADILPSGHQVDKDSKILLSIYASGRMESVWGKDCLEFKPERWITEEGGIQQVSSYKFPVFNAGSRYCLGHLIKPADSMILQMKHGLKVRLDKKTSA
ncbi:Alkane hydroxylase MAH1 [Heracleum sosnowskyi]|uniref:Alkane hydroxylase MAH1 n=1 Tax=Heracleum sosnowskyi TaxID=360622 RepID=A0AAD8MI65_9APIA|nr:Alkane hydroxylase MAH1 [Heracleum sosnowskyi]